MTCVLNEVTWLPSSSGGMGQSEQNHTDINFCDIYVDHSYFTIVEVQGMCVCLGLYPLFGV